MTRQGPHREPLPVIQPHEIGRVVLVKTSVWLLSPDENLAFPTADTPAPSEAGHPRLRAARGA